MPHNNKRKRRNKRRKHRKQIIKSKGIDKAALISQPSNTTIGNKRTISVLENGRAILNFKSNVVTDDDVLPPIGRQYGDGSNSDIQNDQSFNTFPNARFTAASGVALPELPLTVDLYANQQQPKKQQTNVGNVRSLQKRKQFMDMLLAQMGPPVLKQPKNAFISRHHTKADNVNYGISPTMGIMPAPLSSQMSFYGNEEKALLDMASESATTDLDVKSTPMDEMQSLIHKMEAGRIHSPNIDQIQASFINKGFAENMINSKISLPHAVKIPGANSVFFKNNKKDGFDNEKTEKRDEVMHFKEEEDDNEEENKKEQDDDPDNEKEISKRSINLQEEPTSTILKIGNKMYTDVPYIKQGESSATPDKRYDIQPELEKLISDAMLNPTGKTPTIQVSQRDLELLLSRNPIIKEYLAKKKQNIIDPNDFSEGLKTLVSIVENQNKLYQKTAHKKEKEVAVQVISNAIKGSLAGGPNAKFKYIDQDKYENILSNMQDAVHQKDFEQEMNNNAYNHMFKTARKYKLFQ